MAKIRNIVISNLWKKNKKLIQFLFDVQATAIKILSANSTQRY